MKRGQITLFIILAVVILIIVALVSYYFKDISNYNLKDITLPNEIRNYKENMQDCMESITGDAVRAVSSQGGYYQLPRDNFAEITAYYYIKGQKTMPSLRKVGSEIAAYVEDNLDGCTPKEDKLQIEVTEKRAMVDILDDSVNFKIIYNVKITFNNKEYQINEPYETIHFLNLKKAYGIAEQITNIQVQDQENICFSCILQLAEENNIKININSLDSSLLFTIEDRDYRFNFANQY